MASKKHWQKTDDREQNAEVPVERIEADKVVPEEDELPEFLPGFDLAAGLSRLMGNKRLYRKLLVDFGTKYTETASEIREALAANDFDQAKINAKFKQLNRVDWSFFP